MLNKFTVTWKVATVLPLNLGLAPDWLSPPLLLLQEFSLPSITLFERCGLRGKRVILTDGTVNLQLAGGCSRVQSVQVEGGM